MTPIDDRRGEPLSDGLSAMISAVLASAFHPGELERTWLSDHSGLGGWNDPSAVREIWLHVVAKGEHFHFPVRDESRIGLPQDLSELRARLISDLQDWIAETRFGWGQLRLTDQ